MHYFFIEGTFPGYEFLHQNENNPENFYLVQLLTFELLRNKGFFPN